MQRPADTTSDTSASAGGGFARPWLTPGAVSGSRLFRKYAALLFALVASSLIANAAIQMFYTWRESRAAISAIQREKAQGAAAVIEQFIREIEGQVGWTTHANVLAGASGIDQRRFDFLRLLRQAPAVTEVTYVDPQGREQLKVSRLAMDVVGSGADYTADPRFVEAKAKRRHVSSVYFRKESEPYLTLAIAGQGRTVGVTIAEINLKFIWDVVSRIEVGRAGVAYVVDQGGHLIAHPDIGLVLRKTDMSGLAHVAAARARLASAADPIASAGAASSAPVPETALDRNGQEVLTASAPIRSLAWLVMVDQPLSEALAPVRGTFNRSLLVLLGGLGLAVAGGMWLARRMAVPINALAAGAERMGAGDLDHRIDVRTGDEVERLGLAFNAMGSRLKDSYAHLERKVEERTAELQQSLEYQTAISDVLGVIARSPSDLQPVLDQIVRTAAQLGQADAVGLRRRDGETFPLVAHRGYSDEQLAWFAQNYATPTFGVLYETIRTRKTQHVVDALSPERGGNVLLATVVGNKCSLAVPLLRHGELIGTLFLARREPKPFSDRQIKLVETFADQAVIAIENARLFEAEQTRTKELSESLEYQTATSEVLGVISRSPNELQPVLDVIAETAQRLCGSDRAFFFLLKDELYHVVSWSGAPNHVVEDLQSKPIAPGDRGSIIGRISAEPRTLHVPDGAADPEFKLFDPLAPGRARSSLGVPIIQRGRMIGAIIVANVSVKPFTERQIALVETFASQAVIAINNVGLFEEVQTRTKELTESLEYQTATSEVLRVISRSQNKFQPVLDSIAGIAAQLCNAFDATILLSEGSNLRIMAHHGPMKIDFSLLPLGRGSVSGRSVVDRSPIHVEDLMAAGADYPEGYVIARRHGHRTALAIPLLKEGDAVGCLFIRRTEVLPFTDRQISLLQTFADQAVIAIDNTRLFDELAEKNRQLELASQHKSQFLANMSHELRTPLNAILGYTELLADGTYGALAERPKGVLDRIDRNGKHLLGLINDVLDLSKIEAGEMQLALEDYALGSIVQNTITVTEPLARQKGLELKAAIEPNLPLGRGDARRLSQVLLNLVGNAIKFTDKGRIDVAATRDGERFRLTVRDTGPGIPEAEQAKIFEKFQQVDNTSTRRKGGSGLGLSISKELVEMHGGTISVVSAPGEGSTFEVVLPHRVCPTAPKEAP